MSVTCASIKRPASCSEISFWACQNHFHWNKATSTVYRSLFCRISWEHPLLNRSRNLSCTGRPVSWPWSATFLTGIPSQSFHFSFLNSHLSVELWQTKTEPPSQSKIIWRSLLTLATFSPCKEGRVSLSSLQSLLYAWEQNWCVICDLRLCYKWCLIRWDTCLLRCTCRWNQILVEGMNVDKEIPRWLFMGMTAVNIILEYAQFCDVLLCLGHWEIFGERCWP